MTIASGFRDMRSVQDGRDVTDRSITRFDSLVSARMLRVMQGFASEPHKAIPNKAERTAEGQADDDAEDSVAGTKGLRVRDNGREQEGRDRGALFDVAAVWKPAAVKT